MTGKRSQRFDVDLVRQRLGELGMTQGDLAAYLKVDTSAVSRGLGGKRKFSPMEQSLIAAFFTEAEAQFDQNGVRTAPAKAGYRLENLRYYMDLGRIDEATLSMISGINLRELKQILLDAGSPMTDAVARDLSAGLGVDLDGPRQQVLPRPKRREELIPIFAPPTPANLPLFDYMLSPVGSMEAPSALRDVPGAFAMYSPEFGVGTRWHPGDLMFMHPRLPLHRDAEALIVIDDQFLTIGRVASSTAETVSLQIDDWEPTDFPRSKLTAIYKIIGVWFR